ncbi:DUF262 domain-containing protein [Couchioplanes caeruleus]|uniref:GmrSD restriction endonuclease domain-containing protein n=1 Tax=Couchioplanes caeruleus TaxID=56438 RepID=UPI0020BD8AF8|nr:DUF262 domain-containing protein [Couchioplanes caeruleus]UQU64899.1 DUF262 domain-containing protein [Couchioplanes caeruleus]
MRTIGGDDKRHSAAKGRLKTLNALPVVDVDRIDGKPRTVRELFTSRKYSVDYYQREYAWTQANVNELLDDLAGRFLEAWDERHERQETLTYRPYFLGPIVTNNRGGTLFLVDGQQRLTTLTLLLIYLLHLQKARPSHDQVDVRQFIASTRVGRWSFNLDVEDRRACMESLLEGKPPPVAPGDDSVANLWARYQDIEQLFPQELKDHKLPYFIDWFLERVAVVEITTSDQEMALEVFETMNDRGLRLTTTDMLKSYLLAMIQEPKEVEAANRLWRGRVAALSNLVDKGDFDFIRNWLRSKYAETIRERKKEAVPGDFDVIGTAPHKWVRDHREEIGLRKPGDFAALIERDFDRLSGRYLQLLKASQQLTPGFEEVFYNAWNGFTFQYPLILAALSPSDDDETFRRKTRMIAGWADIFVARRIVNYRNFGYSTVAYTMFNHVKDIRDLDEAELAQVLGDKIAEMDDGFDAVANLGLHQRNGNQIRYLLARMAAWLEDQCGGALTFADFVSRQRTHPFEIEHIWANHPDEHPELATDQAFSDQRNKFGGLLLLPKDFNASYGDKPYAEKLEHYYGQNVLAKSLHPRCYENNPTFLRTRAAHGLPFAPVPEFTVSSFSERQELYRRLCEVVWDSSRLGIDVPDNVARLTEEQQPKRHYGVTLKDLLAAGLLRDRQALVGVRSGVTYNATVTAEGRVELDDGHLEESPSTAGAAVLGAKSCNGWTFWQTDTVRGLVRLSRVRDEYLERRRP